MKKIIDMSEYDVRVATSETDVANVKHIDDIAFVGHRGITEEELYKVKEFGVLLLLFHKKTGEIVGEAQFLFRPIPEIPHDFGDGVGYCYGVAIRPEFQGHGLGKILMQKIWDIAVARGLDEIHLSVRVENHPSLKLMFGQGYRIIQYRPDFYGPNKIEGPRLIMAKNIHKEHIADKEYLVSVPAWGLFDQSVHDAISEHIAHGRHGVRICHEGIIFA